MPNKISYIFSDIYEKFLSVFISDRLVSFQLLNIFAFFQVSFLIMFFSFSSRYVFVKKSAISDLVAKFVC